MDGNESKVMKYGILDDEGKVVRWLDYKPCHSQFIVKRIPRNRKHKIDWDNIEEAPF